MELGHQNGFIQGQDAVHHGILSGHRDVLFARDRCDTSVEIHADQGIGRIGAEQRRRQEPQSWAACFGRRVSNMQQTSIGAEQRVFELEELHLAGGSDMAKGASAASGIPCESEPHTTHGTVGGGHPNGVVADAGRNWQLRRLTAGDIDAHDGRVIVLRDVDQAGGRLLLDKHGAVEALVQLLVRGVGDIGREYIVLAGLLGCHLEAGPNAVADLKHTMGAVAWRRDINRLYDGGLGREVLAGIHKEQLVVGLQRQPHHARVHRRWPHAMELGATVLSHGERVVSNGLLGGRIQLDLDKLAVGHLCQQHEVRVRHARKLMCLSGGRHQILGNATAHE